MTLDQAFRRALNTCKSRMRPDSAPKMRLKECYRALFDAGVLAERERCARLCREIREDRHDLLARAAVGMCVEAIEKGEPPCSAP